MNDNSLLKESEDGHLQRELDEKIPNYTAYCVSSPHIDTSKLMPPGDVIQ